MRWFKPRRGVVEPALEYKPPPASAPVAAAPHCDTSILHAPGVCEFCDMHPEWQEYRSLAGIAFTGEATTATTAPCPSTWRRAPSVRDAWPGNRPGGY